MDTVKLSSTTKMKIFTAISAIVIGSMLAFFWYFGEPGSVEVGGLSSSSRMINGFFTALLMAMTLSITLTANLYSPKLAKIFVRHPIVVYGISLILLNHVSFILSNLISKTHPWHDRILFFNYALSCLTVIMMMPFLFYLSRFIRPKYFLPIIVNNITGGLDIMYHTKGRVNILGSIFESIDVLNNIGRMASRRDDKHLVGQVYRKNHIILKHLMTSYNKRQNEWRKGEPVFLIGISSEGRQYLAGKEIWPEAYLLGKMVKMVNSFPEQLNEVTPLFCENLIESVIMTIEADRDDLTELHIMIFNSMVRKAIESRNLERFQSLSYYYRLLIEELVPRKELMNNAVTSLIHYAEMTPSLGIATALETVLYDLGQIVVYFADQDEDHAIDFLTNFVGPTWKKHIAGEGHLSLVASRSLARTYWETLSHEKNKISHMLKDKYLINHDEHLKTIEYLLTNNRPLHYEYTDRLLRFTYLSRPAERMARDFYHQEMINSA